VCSVLLYSNASGASSNANALEPHRDLSCVDYPWEFRKTPCVWFHTHVRCPDRWTRLWDRVYCLGTADKAPYTCTGSILFLWVLQVKKRADERTRTADLISLRVIGHALQGLAEACKCRISKRLSLLGVSACCTVLRSQWYQIGIRTSDSYSPTADLMARPRDLRSHNPPMPVYRRCRMLQNRLIYRTRVDQGIRSVLQAFEDGGDHRLSHRR
jgi:hypothetical protein